MTGKIADNHKNFKTVFVKINGVKQIFFKI